MSSVHDATSIIRDRRRRSDKRRLRGWLLTVLVLLLVVLGVWLVGFSSVLALRTVKVTGTRILTVEQVTRTADAPMGRPLVRVRENELATRVATLPEVDRVTVSRRWPGTVEIAVTERVPAYALKVGEGWSLVDTKGVPYAQTRETPDGLVQVTAPVDQPIVLAEIAAVLNQLSPTLRPQVTAAKATSRDSVEIVVAANRTIRFGSAENMELKNQVAELMLAQTVFGWIDVSSPSRPVGR